MATAQEMLIRLTASGASEVEREFAQVAGSVDTLNTKLSSIEANTRAMTLGVGLLVAQMATDMVSNIAQATIGVGIAYDAMLEQARIAFTQMIGDAQQAGKFITDLQNLANETHLQFPGLRDNAQLLMAMGIQGKEVIPVLRDLADAAGALGGDLPMRMQRISLALGEMFTRGTVSAREMNQLARDGIPAWEALAQATGKSLAQVREAVQKREITGEVGINAVLRYIEEHFQGLAEQQAHTYSGLLSTFNDQIRQTAGAMLQPVETLLRDSFERVNTFLRSIDFKASAQAAGQELGVIIEDVKGFFSQIEAVSQTHGLGALDATLATISLRLKEGFGPEASAGFDRVTEGIGQLADRAGTTVQMVIALAAGMAATVGPGTSFANVLGTIFSLIDEHKEVLAGVVAGFLAFQALSAIIPVIAGAAAAIASFVTVVGTAFEFSGAAAGIAALVAALGGPLTLAFVAIAAAVAIFVAAWIGDWGQIQEKAATGVALVNLELDRLQTMTATETQAVGALFALLGTNIGNSANYIGTIVDTLVGKFDIAGKVETFLNAAADKFSILPIRLLAALATMIPIAGQIIGLFEMISGAANRLQQDAATAAATAAGNASLQAAVDEQNRKDAERRQQESGGSVLDKIKAQYDQFYEEQRARIAALQTSVPTGPASVTGAGGDPVEKATRARAAAETAIQGFMRQLESNTANFEAVMSSAGAKAAAAFSEAFATNTGAAGAAAAREMDALIHRMETAGIANWRQLGDDLAGAEHDALISRLDSDKDKAIAKLEEIDHLILEKSRLTAENFQAAVGAEMGKGVLGASGSTLMDELGKAAAGGDKAAAAIQTAGNAFHSIVDKLFTDAPIEMATDWSERLFGLIATFARDKTDDAKESVRSFLAWLNQQGPLELLKSKVDEAVSKAEGKEGREEDKLRQRTADQIEAVRAQAQAKIDEHDRTFSLQESERQQTKDMNDAFNALMRDRRRAREDEQTALREQDTVADTALKRAQQIADLHARGTRGGTPVGGLTTTGSAVSEIDALHKRWAEEDARAAQKLAEAHNRVAAARTEEDTDASLRQTHEDQLFNLRDMYRRIALSEQELSDEDRADNQIRLIQKTAGEELATLRGNLAIYVGEQNGKVAEMEARLTAINNLTFATPLGAMRQMNEYATNIGRVLGEVIPQALPGSPLQPFGPPAGPGRGGTNLAPLTGTPSQGGGGLTVIFNQNAPIIGVPGGLDMIANQIAPILARQIDTGTLTHGGALG